MVFSQVLSRLALVAAAALLAPVAQSQAIWSADQVNTRICQWKQPRAALLRDTVYLDGGNLWWQPGLKDGSIGTIEDDGNPLGRIYTLNFSKPFKTHDNITALFGTLQKGLNGGAASNIAPNYLDGALLANDHEFFLYGGLLKETSEFPEPPGDSVLKYEEYQYGVEKPGFLPGFGLKNLPKGMTRYLAYGGAANAPSENKAFYFSGLRSPSFGPVHVPGGSPDSNAVNVSNTLVVLDMTTQQQEKWSNVTLPSGVKGRANPELVWVPVGEQGILVALGGVIYPDFAGEMVAGVLSDNEPESKKISPGFMSTIDIYDIKSGDWFSQPTVDAPSQLTRGCAVVAPAQDSSSFNIYYYGGYDGLAQDKPFNDDVWVLSLPSFTWTKLTQGSGSGRAGHKCFMPYPDRMLAIGGYTSSTGTMPTCLQETIRVLDLNTGTWLDEYDPATYSNYSVPDVIVKRIGGSPTGGATATTPLPSGWVSTDLSDVFSKQYPTSKILKYWPYPVETPTNNTNPNVPPPDTGGGGGGGVPSFLPPVLGVVLGLMFLTMIAVLILLYRRRKLFKAGNRGAISEAGTEDTNGHRIMSWMRGQGSEPKAPTVTETSDYTTPSSPADESAVGLVPQQPSSMAEIMGTEIRHPVELMDTSPRAELYDTGLSHVDVLNRHSNLGSSPGSGSLNNPSYYSSGTHQVDHASTLSASSTGLGQQQQQPMQANISPFDYYRPDSDLLATSNSPGGATGPSSAQASPKPALASVAEGEAVAPPSTTSPPPAVGVNSESSSRVLSGISNLSEGDRAHLRQTSDATVSSVTTGAGGDRIVHSPEPGQQQPQNAVITPSPGPVSPPTAGESEGDDYLSARSVPVVSPLAPPPPVSGTGGHGNNGNSPLRRSVFFESREDMTDNSNNKDKGGGAS
ncbi:hypothetical protein B0H66DRAFT_575753 [Apodospora peruviana]|uniref:Galactose oxidase/kelch, beta-propeller n=1 Tax=Apodospora peruviana TaxID=516989 RepID=A0AAE0M4N9_9PEZI|nr:hypothetical protein B0H66DRAFT_575753 [Apodospora peruviana]